MLENKKINIVLSIIIAFAGWIYVIYSVDPTTTRTYRDVSVTYSNEDVLEESGIAMKSSDTSSIEVTVSAKRTILNKLSSDDIQAVADLSDAGEGENTIDLTVTTPSDVTVQSQSVKTITVSTEKIETRNVHVRAEYEVAVTDGTEPLITGLSQELVEVSGAKSLVESVKYVQLPVSSDKVTDEERTFSVKGVAIDDKGDAVSHITVNPKKVSVTVIRGTLKTVPLTVNVNNPDNDDYLRTYDAPEEIIIKGTEEDIDDVDGIETGTVDLSNMDESGSQELEFILPPGIQVANDSVGMTITVNVTEYETKEISFPTEDITVENLESDYALSYEDDNITIEVIDTSSKIEELTADDFTVTINAKNLEEGTYSVQPKVSTEKELHKVSLEDNSIYVDVAEK